VGNVEVNDKNVLWASDGGGDIGAAADNRPDNIYAATQVKVGASSTITSTSVTGERIEAIKTVTSGDVQGIYGHLTRPSGSTANALSGLFVADNESVAGGASVGVQIQNIGTQDSLAGLLFFSPLAVKFTSGIEFGYGKFVTGISFTGATISGNAIEMAGFGINATNWNITGAGDIESTTQIITPKIT